MVSQVLFSSNTEEWGTPLDLYKELDNEFHFTTDPCTTKDNPLGTEIFYTKETDGLTQPWYGNVFINPPYGNNITNWIRKSWEKSRYFSLDTGPITGTIVMLLPARTDTRWFHDFIYQDPRAEIRFIKGRLTFRGAKNSAPFPSMVVIFRQH